MPNYTIIQVWFQQNLDKRSDFFRKTNNCQTISFVLQIRFFLLWIKFRLFLQNICFGFTGFSHRWKSVYPLWIKWITLCTIPFSILFTPFWHVDKFIHCAQLYFDDVSRFDFFAIFLCILAIFRFCPKTDWQKNCKYNLLKLKEQFIFFYWKSASLFIKTSPSHSRRKSPFLWKMMRFFEIQKSTVHYHYHLC